MLSNHPHKVVNSNLSGGIANLVYAVNEKHGLSRSANFTEQCMCIIADGEDMGMRAPAPWMYAVVLQNEDRSGSASLFGYVFEQS